MRDYLFEIVFVTGKSERVWAGCEEMAQIIAQARQIELAQDYRVAHVIKMDL